MSKIKEQIEAIKFSAKQRERRVSKGLKASWVATQMGVTAPCLSLLESGKRRWNQELLFKFQKAIGEA